MRGRHLDTYIGCILESEQGRLIVWRPVDVRGAQFGLDKVQKHLTLLQKTRSNGSRIVCSEGTLRIEGEFVVARTAYTTTI